jgi:toxin ParE1/3/4
MKYNVSILSEAVDDIDDAYIWYELRQIDLGNKFYKSLDESIHYISYNPYSCEEIYKEIRRYVIKKFPYGIYYKVIFDVKEIQIIGVIHFKRSSRLVRKRL